MAVDILVLGATGFTGRLITRYLASHPQRNSFTLAIGVRSKTKGAELLKSLGIEDGRVQLVEVDVTRYETVEAAVRDTKVVLNTVGPYWLWGTSVVRACTLLGKRYVDITGEPHFVRNIVELFDHTATQTGAIIVPACGFDSVPSDLAVFLANRTLKEGLGPQTQLGLSQSFFKTKVGVSGGSFATLAAEIEEVPQVYRDQSYQDYALSPVKGHPSPSSGKVVRIPFSSPSEYGGRWIMASVNRSIVQRTFGLNELLSKHSAIVLASSPESNTLAQIRHLTYGQQFRYVEYLTTGSAWLATTVSSTLLGVWLALMFYVPPVWWFAKMFLPKSGEGPSEHELKTGYLTVTNFTEAAGAPSTWAKTIIHGKGDPGYLITAGIVSECALALVLDDASLPPHARFGGVLTPATALGGALVSRLEAASLLQFESKIVHGEEESRKDQ